MKNTLAGIVAGTILGVGGVMGAGAVTKEAPLDTIEKAQSAYFAEHGTYVQVVPYETPSKEKGYHLEYEDEQGIYSKGFGPEAESRTRETLKVPLTASST